MRRHQPAGAALAAIRIRVAAQAAFTCRRALARLPPLSITTSARRAFSSCGGWALMRSNAS